jgi:glycosyltransferase involved in cell wall biosynthesis
LPSLQSALESSGFGHPDVTWIDSVVWESVLDLVPARRTIFRIADRSAGFARHHPDFDHMERRIAGRVDAVAYTAETLEPHVRSLEPRRLIHLPNGVDLDRFTRRVPPPPEYNQIPAPRAVYVGAIAEWFDFSLLNHLVQALPHVSFVLIGPDELARRRLSAAPNLHVVGRQPHDRVPAFLQHADVGLIPFDARNHAELVGSVHPLKLYEYVASGLPTVAAEWPELLSLRSPARTYRTPDEALAAIQAALDGPRPDDHAWLEGTDWRTRVMTMVDALGLRHSA